MTIETETTPDEHAVSKPAASRPPLTILLAAPRGFCAGVDRAIQIVEMALQRFGPPVYVRHEIVHNRTVVESLKAKGAVFVEELDEVPDDAAPVVFSAHGVPKSVPEEATRRKLFHLDATCPLVSKVHIEVEKLHAQGFEIILIGHARHPEVIGTMGQLPEGAVRLIETVADAENYAPISPDRLAYVTQTTLSVDDTRAIVDVLCRRFPAIVGPHKNDICYATTNRQSAVKVIADRSDVVLVVGAPNSSNSVRLVEVAEKMGCRAAFLVQSLEEIPWDKIGTPRTLGLTAGASAPEHLVQDILGTFAERFDTHVEHVSTASENVIFKLPRALQDSAA